MSQLNPACETKPRMTLRWIGFGVLCCAIFSSMLGLALGTGSSFAAEEVTAPSTSTKLGDKGWSAAAPPSRLKPRVSSTDEVVTVKKVPISIPGAKRVTQKEQGYVARVTTMLATHQTNTELLRSFAGVVKPRRTSELGFNRTGRVVSIRADQGEFVEAGSLLAELDTAAIQAGRSVLLAQKEAAEARLKEYIAGPRIQSIEAARSQVLEYQALRDLAFATYQRRQKLAGSEAIAQQDLDDSRLQLAASESRLSAQKEILEELLEGTREEQIEGQRAEVKQLEARIESLNVDLKESQLIAPYDAIVSRRLVDEGMIVGPGTVLLRLLETESPEIWIGVPPDTVRRLSVDQEHALTIGEEKFTGVIRSILPELDAATRTQTVILNPLWSEDWGTNPNRQLFGQIAHLHLSQTINQEGFWLPLSSLSRGIRGLWSVYVLESSELNVAPSPAVNEPICTVKRCEVEVVQVDTDRVLVRGTIKSDDEIVVMGGQNLSPGQRVRPTRLDTLPLQPSSSQKAPTMEVEENASVIEPGTSSAVK